MIWPWPWPQRPLALALASAMTSLNTSLAIGAWRWSGGWIWLLCLSVITRCVPDVVRVFAVRPTDASALPWTCCVPCCSDLHHRTSVDRKYSTEGRHHWRGPVGLSSVHPGRRGPILGGWKAAGAAYGTHSARCSADGCHVPGASAVALRSYQLGPHPQLNEVHYTWHNIIWCDTIGRV